MRAAASSTSLALLAAFILRPATFAAAADCPEQVIPLDAVDDGCLPKPLPNVSKVPDVGSLKTPESPAFMALGLAPSQIQRPATPTAVVMTLASGFLGGGRVGPSENFALQTSPYWLWAHPDLTAEDMDSQGLWAPLRNLSFSAATVATQVDVPDAAGQVTKLDVTRAALGARTTLLAGEQSAAATTCQQFLVQYLDDRSAALANARRAFTDEWDKAHPAPTVPQIPSPSLKDFPNDPDGFERAVDAFAAKRAAARQRAPELAAYEHQRDDAIREWLERYGASVASDPRVQTCLATIHERQGLMAEGAGAYVLTLPGGDLSRRNEIGGRRVIAWLTVGYIRKLAREALALSVLGVGRVEDESGRPGDAHTVRWDAGGRVVFAWDRYGVSGELTHRWEKTGPTANAGNTGMTSEQFTRFALGLDYRVVGGAWVSATFGKDFGTGITKSPLIALANVQWNIGLDRGVQADTTLTRKSAGAPP